jgi:hypothetical protein
MPPLVVYSPYVQSQNHAVMQKFVLERVSKQINKLNNLGDLKHSCEAAELSEEARKECQNTIFSKFT